MNAKYHGLVGAWLVAGVFLVAAPQLVQSSQLIEKPGAQLDELEDVQVSGTSLHQIRLAIVALENRFYQRYNAVNSNSDFDVNCSNTTQLGTHISHRICRTAYFENAEAEYAQSRLGGWYAPEPQVVELERRDDYRKHALGVINSDRQLLRMVREHDALERRYREEHKRRFSKH